MLQVNVSLLKMSAERFLPDALPELVHINVNVNILEAESKTENRLEIPFIFTVNYNPFVASINIQGKAIVLGEKNEVKKIYDECERNKASPPAIAQIISNIVFVEALLISKALNIPPPLPLPQASMAKQETKVDYRV
jgi:hypothetical protein